MYRERERERERSGTNEVLLKSNEPIHINLIHFWTISNFNLLVG